MTKNIICFINSVKFWGGGEKLHFEYACELKKRGFTVHIIANLQSKLAEKSRKAGIPIYQISINTFSFINKRTINKMSNYFVQNKINTVFFSTSQDMKIASISGKKAKVEKIIYLRGLAVPVKNSLINRKLLVNNVTHILANSQETKRTINQNIKSHKIEKKTTVIYHGIDLDIFDKEKKDQKFIYEKKETEIIIGNAGRLTKQKGQHYFIDIAKKLVKKNINFKILIAGDGDLIEELAQRIKKNNLSDKIILLGFVKEMTAFMNFIDIFALTSSWEGFGYVIVEAMACNKPVVGFNISSNPEIVTHNKTGFLVEYPDTTQFTDKIETLINNKKLLLKIGE